MALTDWKDVATIIGIVVAVLTYLTNSYFQFRTKRIENLKRYFDAHNKLFEPNGFIMANIKELEAGTYKRNVEDKDMEVKFNRFLGGVEEIAYYTSYGAVPMADQVYTFGWFAKKIGPHLTNDERTSLFWELGSYYIGELGKAVEDYEKLPNDKRATLLRMKFLAYKKFSC